MTWQSAAESLTATDSTISVAWISFAAAVVVGLLGLIGVIAQLRRRNSRDHADVIRALGDVSEKVGSVKTYAEHAAASARAAHAAASAAAHSADKAHQKIDDLTAAVLTRDQIIDVATVLHPELSADQIIELAGDHPDLSIEQARQMRAQRLPPRSHDNPEEHP